jgi:hypothetical protein
MPRGGKLFVSSFATTEVENGLIRGQLPDILEEWLIGQEFSVFGNVDI